MVFRYDRFGRGGDHTPFNQAGYAGVRLTTSPRTTRTSTPLPIRSPTPRSVHREGDPAERRGGGGTGPGATSAGRVSCRGDCCDDSGYTGYFPGSAGCYSSGFQRSR